MFNKVLTFMVNLEENSKQNINLKRERRKEEEVEKLSKERRREGKGRV